jgi:hypothetical protein
LADADSEIRESIDVFPVETFPATDDLSVYNEEIELTASPRGKDEGLGRA